MRLKFVNHASFIVEGQGVRLICDPWLEGVVFNRGWDLLAKSRFDFDDFRNITHIWFSHEHPDHFHPSNLNEIPQQHRRNITVLFQATRDGQVVNLCRKLGFKEVVELASNEWRNLEPGLKILCRPSPSDSGDEDSWMCLKSEDTTLLSINDCQIDNRQLAEDIKRRVGPVDVLFTQFSYAGFVGNREAIEQRRAAAACKLADMTLQVDVLRPRFVVPFASFVWFCHEENFYMNRGVNKIGDVVQHLQERESAKVIVLYPGDTWIVGEKHDSERSLSMWQKESASLESRIQLKTLPVTRQQLLEASEGYIGDRRQQINPLVAHLWAAGVVHPLRGKPGRNRGWFGSLASFLFLRTEPIRVWILDHEGAYQLDSRRLRLIDLPRELCDVELSAESLLFYFRFPWGCETLQINGRLRELHKTGRRAFCGYFRPGRMLHYGHQSLSAEAANIFLRRARRQVFGRGHR